MSVRAVKKKMKMLVVVFFGSRGVVCSANVVMKDGGKNHFESHGGTTRYFAGGRAGWGEMLKMGEGSLAAGGVGVSRARGHVLLEG